METIKANSLQFKPLLRVLLIMINEALRLFRVFHDLKLIEMADKLGISPSYLSEIEKGKKEPSLKLLDKYSEIFKIPTSSILSFSEKLEHNQKGIKAKIAKGFVNFLENIENANHC
jgi:transcriptional regulator with XRE-family HTH domain